MSHGPANHSRAPRSVPHSRPTQSACAVAIDAYALRHSLIQSSTLYIPACTTWEAHLVKAVLSHSRGNARRCDDQQEAEKDGAKEENEVAQAHGAQRDRAQLTYDGCSKYANVQARYTYLKVPRQKAGSPVSTTAMAGSRKTARRAGMRSRAISSSLRFIISSSDVCAAARRRVHASRFAQVLAPAGQDPRLCGLEYKTAGLWRCLTPVICVVA